MITMIKKIKDIGMFKDYESRKTGLTNDFSHINLIYGLNTYGKSTICDVLKSASDNTSDRIEQRKTIPDGERPEVVINTDSGCVNFRSNRWNGNALENRIAVFDDEFIAKNVFSGLELMGDRDVKENFTDFILGDEGVKAAREIEALKKEIKEIKNKMEKTIPPSQNGHSENDIKKYVDINVNETLDDLERGEKRLEEKMNNEKLIYENRKALDNFQDFASYTINEAEILVEKVEKVSEVLMKTYTISSESIIKYQDYKKEIDADDNFDQWLSQGVQYLNKDEKCPFCGQKIVDHNIIEIIKDVFGDDYQKYKKKILSDLDGINIQWDVLKLANTILKAEHKLNDAKKIFGSELSKFDDCLQKLYKSAELEENELRKVISKLQDLYKLNLEIKRSLPNNAVEFGVKTDALFERYKSLCKEYNDCIVMINELLNKIRIKAQKDDEKSSNTEQELNKFKIKITRIKEGKECLEWKSLFEDKKRLENYVRDKSIELEENQKKYLDQYFESIDKIFKTYGAKKFNIKRGAVTRRGNRDVIGINVLFNGVPINNKQMSVFSTSDKRALAMAVFMAKIENMSTEEKNSIIVVLDDPITSFDENRIRNVIQHIRMLSRQLNQTIIFTHHFSFARHIKDMCEEVNFYQLKNIPGDVGNGIFDMHADECLIDGLEKMFSDIVRFNEESIDAITGNDLRKFIEAYLKSVFSKQYKYNGLATMKLGECIDKLFEMRLISEEVKDKLHGYRMNFNMDSHAFTTSNVEDIRAVSSEMIDYIFDDVKIGKSL